jgi:hypothetical protein
VEGVLVAPVGDEVARRGHDTPIGGGVRVPRVF